MRRWCIRQSAGINARLALCALLGAAVASRPALAQTTYLDNGWIKIGADLLNGGAITYLSPSGSTASVVNIHDTGRMIQQSYYAGPCPYIPLGATQHPAWAGWCWNPVQAGSAYGDLPERLASSNDGITIYVKSIPYQWALRNVITECTLETWITLDENRAHVRNRLTNDRSDTRWYSAKHQELPAIYTAGTLYRLFSYTGMAPFTGGELTEFVNRGPPWVYWRSTENWAALVNGNDWGLGVFHPGATLTVGGFHGTPGTGGPYQNNTGYISPLQQDYLDHDIVYDYDYTLILGSLDEIRAYVYAHRPDPRPHYVFDHDRQHCHYRNAEDDGRFDRGFLRVNLRRDGAAIVGPDTLWNAADAPTLDVTAAFHTQSSVGEIWFATPDHDFSATRRVSFTQIPDSTVRTYSVDLRSHPLYTGPIGGIRLVPVVANRPGDFIDLYSIIASEDPTILGDFDQDGDVDQTDFSHLQACFTDIPPIIAPGCEDADLDHNDLVAQADLSIFLRCFSGAGIAVDPGCRD